MIETEVQSELLKRLEQLSPVKQWQVLGFARSLAKGPPRGVPGDQLLRFAGTMTHDEAQEFLKAIEEDCERIDDDEW